MGLCSVLWGGASIAPHRRNLDERCSKRMVPDSMLPRLADSIEIDAGRAPASGEYSDLTASSATVRWGAQCITIVVLSYDNEHGGGLAFLDDGLRPFDVMSSFPGARAIQPAGAARVLFQYTSTMGSGLYESRFVALCPLDRNVWVECLEIVAEKNVALQEYDPRDSLAAGEMMKLSSEIRIAGDTVIQHRQVILRARGDRSPRKVDLGLSRFLLPR